MVGLRWEFDELSVMWFLLIVLVSVNMELFLLKVKIWVFLYFMKFVVIMVKSIDLLVLFGLNMSVCFILFECRLKK